MITSKAGYLFAQKCIDLILDKPEEVKEEPAAPPEPKEPVEGPKKQMGITDYEKWENFEDPTEEEQKEFAKKWAGGCSQDHRKERELYERPTPEKLQAAQLFKEQGNTAFREKNYSLATVHYRKGLLQLDYTFPDTEKEKKEFYSVKSILHNNMGLMKFYLEEYDEALNNLDQVLKSEPNNTKALFRKAQVYLKRDLFDETKLCLRKILEIEPGNAQARESMQELNDKIASYKKKQTKMYDQMINS